jgi:hypothetical protein
LTDKNSQLQIPQISLHLGPRFLGLHVDSAKETDRGCFPLDQILEALYCIQSRFEQTTMADWMRFPLLLEKSNREDNEGKVQDKSPWKTAVLTI